MSEFWASLLMFIAILLGVLWIPILMVVGFFRSIRLAIVICIIDWALALTIIYFVTRFHTHG